MDEEQGKYEEGKSPTWQWLAGILVGILLLIAGATLNETRGDIRDVKKANADVCDRVTILETANKMQFEAIRAWREDVKTGMREIAERIDKHERTTTAMRKARINE